MKDNFDDYLSLERKRLKRLEDENELMKKALLEILNVMDTHSTQSLAL